MFSSLMSRSKPMPLPVRFVSCITPFTPVGEPEQVEMPDSACATAKARPTGTLYFSA
jgi:hypothetical protein